MGLFGYFPTYLLGAMKAAQFYRAANLEHPELEGRLSAGDVSVWIDWLKRHIHQHGSFFSADELVVNATGSTLATDALIEHFQKRYG